MDAIHAVIISDNADGIAQTCSECGLETSVFSHSDWEQSIVLCETLGLCIVDAVNKQPEDIVHIAQELAAGESGPVIVFLVDDCNHFFDLKARFHQRIVIHPMSMSLITLLQEIQCSTVVLR